MFLAVGGISFYIMIIDASAVVNGYNQCTNKFAVSVPQADCCCSLWCPSCCCCC